jgi:hypothetical protein
MSLHKERMSLKRNPNPTLPKDFEAFEKLTESEKRYVCKSQVLGWCAVDRGFTFGNDCRNTNFAKICRACDRPNPYDDNVSRDVLNVIAERSIDICPAIHSKKGK